MKQAWVRLNDWYDELAVAALESGADALVVPEGFAEAAKALGRILVVSPDGDLLPGRDVWMERLDGPGDEARIREHLSAGRTVLVDGLPGRGETGQRAWDVIPVENLLASGGGRLFLPAGSRGEIDLALGVLEKGVAGVLISSGDPAEIRDLVSSVKRARESCSFETAVIERISAAGMGDRVCVDTCTRMADGEGMLVGNSSGFLFFVQAETGENPYVAPRPFRVNGGPVHSYVRAPGGAIRYLSELKAGESVLLVRPDGSAEESTVGRVKMERRPLVLVEASLGGRRGSILLQNAETVRLTGPGGEPISIARLQPGDTVLVAAESAGRHFGMKIEERIREI
ncbi:MAG: 3-dehydroquinate synthase II [Desulfobacteraceae bacterium]|nr:3-dehydroquinate synthase II [Desulfobacteraceae bacterium]